jgi:calcium-dependent protein kinase
MGCVHGSEQSSTITGQSTIQAADLIPDLPASMQVLDVLGSGEFSEVRKCLDASGHLIALKCVPWTKVRKDVRVVSREVSILRKVTHKNIVQWLGCYKDVENFYIAMELCEGGNLRDLIEIADRVREERLKILAREVLEALVYLHSEGIAHRDVKPENILLTSEGSVKLADFGLSRCLKRKQLTVVGTPYYIAPEVLRGKYTYQCDMWSLGVVLFVALTGRRPFEGNNIDHLFSNIQVAEVQDWSGCSPTARDLIQHLLVKSAAQRFTASQALNHSWVQG